MVYWKAVATAVRAHTGCCISKTVAIGIAKQLNAVLEAEASALRGSIKVSPNSTDKKGVDGG